MSGLRVLITNHTLGNRAGSELYVRDLATALLERGHHPIAYTTIPGEVAEELRRATIPVIDDLRILTTPPDIIHGHHHLETLTAVLHFPNTPAISYCHGWLPWEETPPRSPRIYRYVAVDHTCYDRLAFEHGIPEEKIRVLLNFVDLQKFQPRGPLPPLPRKALVFSNQADENTHLPAVREACAQAGIELDVIGLNSGRVSRHPEQDLVKYDLVFAIARAALEALAVGTAVILCDATGAGPMVTTRDIELLRPLNFGIRTLQQPLKAESLLREIGRYDPADAAEVSRWIRATAGREAVVDQIVSLYHEVIAEHHAADETDRLDEARETAAYLRWLNRQLASGASHQHDETAALRQALEESRTIVEEKEMVLAQRDEGIAWLREELTRSQTARLAQKEQEQLVLKARLDERERIEQVMLARLSEEVSQWEARLAELENQMASLHQARRSEEISQREARLAELGNQMASLHQQVAESEAALRQHQEEDKATLTEKARLILQRDEGIAWLRQELDSSQQELQRIHASKWWRWIGIWWAIRARLRVMSHPVTWLWQQRGYWRVRAQVRQTIARMLPAAIKRLIKGSALYPSPSSLIPPATRNLPAPTRADVPQKRDEDRSLSIYPAVSEEALTAILNRQPPETAHHRADIICFSIIDWDFRYQRPQQLMSQFAAQGHRVFYLSTTRFLSANATPRIAVREIKENVFEVSLAAQRPPDVYGEVIEGLHQRELLASLAELRRTWRIDEAIGYVMIASWGSVALAAQQQWGWQTIYDCMDEWENFPGIKPALLEMELRLVKECDLLVVTAQRLFDKWRKYERPMVLARNAVDYDFYLRRCHPNNLLTEVKHPVIGYYGAIADWFDVVLMKDIATRRPAYTFVLLGGVFDVDVSSLQVLPNVRLLGQQPYETMPQYLYHFDACIIPFKLNAITEATDPVKLYEYLSGGKPVVSVPLPELEPYREYVYIAEGRDDFVAQLDLALAEDSSELAAQRRALAQQHTWEKRCRSIQSALVEVTPRASIIIVTWQNLAITQLCLESLISNTEYPNYEIIVVDNNSNDGTQAYLKYLANRQANLKIILNPTNNGFARANNQGIAISSGESLVLLNNDTIVPPGWLSRLLRHLRDPAIGLVGPVTNFVGNEAKIEVPYQTWAEMENFAREYTWAHDQQVADIYMLAMFCVALRRETYEATGPLDEQFGIGMFEDDDYTQRLKAAGYRVICAADVFVHHFGQAAFKKLIKSGEYNPLFEENRRRFEAKMRGALPGGGSDSRCSRLPPESKFPASFFSRWACGSASGPACAQNSRGRNWPWAGCSASFSRRPGTRSSPRRPAIRSGRCSRNSVMGCGEIAAWRKASTFLSPEQVSPKHRSISCCCPSI